MIIAPILLFLTMRWLRIYLYWADTTYMPYKNPQSVQDFYKKLDEQTKLENEYKLTGKKPEGYDPAFLNRLKAAKKQLSPLSKQERMTISNPHYSLEQRKSIQKQIQQKRIQIVTRALGR